jgi:hypothetical protein
MQNLPMDMNFNKKEVNMYFAALLPELLSKNTVSFFLDTLYTTAQRNQLHNNSDETKIRQTL